MHRLIVYISTAVLLVAIAPARAHADGFVSPFLGVNFGNPSANGRAIFGAQATWMGKGAIGFEADFGYSPSFFGNEGEFGSNRVVTAMGNLVIGIPVGGTHGPGFRPYVTAGAGLIYERFDVPGTSFAASNRDPGVNVGAGFVSFFTDKVGLRGDVRYFQDLNDNGTIESVDFGSFHFWRASAGLALRF